MNTPTQIPFKWMFDHAFRGIAAILLAMLAWAAVGGAIFLIATFFLLVTQGP